MTTAAPGSSRTYALFGITAALAMFGAAQGLSYPLYTILMQKQGMSAAEIGLSAAMMPLGLVLSASLVPPAVERFGARSLAVGCSIGAAVCFLAIGGLQNAVGWYGLRFLLGFLVNPLYILGEVWALALAEPARRGRIMGIFNAVMGAGYAAGPLVLSLMGTAGWSPFLIGAAGFVICALVLAMVSHDLSGFDGKDDAGAATGGFLWFAALAPALLIAVGVAAATQTSTYSLMPVYGASFGLAEGALAALVTALSVGNIVLQIPLGLAAERTSGRFMIIVCALATAACASALPFAMGSNAVWPILVVMGGVGYGVYTMALVELGDRFSGKALVAGNAAFALMWGAGGIVGPPGVGFVLYQAGSGAFPLMLGLLSGGLSVFAAYRALSRRTARG